MSHACECKHPAGSTHGNCNRCFGQLPRPNHLRVVDPPKGWTGSKVRSRAVKAKKKAK